MPCSEAGAEKMANNKVGLPYIAIRERFSALEVGETIPDSLIKTNVPSLWKKLQAKIFA